MSYDPNFPVADLPGFNVENPYDFRTQRKEYTEYAKLIHSQFRSLAEEFFPMDWSQANIELVHRKATEDGHSEGYSGVWNQYYDLVDFVNEVLENQK
jgi:hypothetical protein